MGNEALVEYANGRERAQVKAHLDGQALELRGGRKLRVPLTTIAKAEVDGDRLRIETASTKFTLQLGAKDAALWARKILNPPSLATKLGVKADRTVLLVGKLPPEIVAAAMETAGVTKVASMPVKLGADITVLALEPTREAATISAAAKKLRAGKALWLVYQKGQAFNGDLVIAASRAAGLKDTKVARISETHSGLRFIK
ncbi:MAG: hypothetical protein ABL973_20715 [Micropepsaceae bacterium]